jgi:hypothetical protein
MHDQAEMSQLRHGRAGVYGCVVPAEYTIAGGPARIHQVAGRRRG